MPFLTAIMVIPVLLNLGYPAASAAARPLPYPGQALPGGCPAPCAAALFLGGGGHRSPHRRHRRADPASRPESACLRRGLRPASPCYCNENCLCSAISGLRGYLTPPAQLIWGTWLSGSARLSTAPARCARAVPQPAWKDGQAGGGRRSQPAVRRT